MAFFTTYSTEHLTGTKEESKKLLERFGDLYAFLYLPNFDKFIREKVLLFREPTGQHLAFIGKDHWTEKHPLQFSRTILFGSVRHLRLGRLGGSRERNE